MQAGLSRILFCDYDGDFEYADVLSSLSYVVDQIRPESLRAVNVGDHALYLFSFESREKTHEVLEVCEKLKAAELYTPIVLLCRSEPAPEFLEHQRKSHLKADAYLAHLRSEAQILDCLDEFLGIPKPFFLRHPVEPKAEETKTEVLKKDEAVEVLQKQVASLEAELLQVREEAVALDKALEAQRNFYKPKLKAMLEGQKLKVQSETESLKVRVAEVEAKLLDREARIKELEQSRKNYKKELRALNESHQRAQEKLRDFYQSKIKSLQGQEPTAPSEEEVTKTEVIPKNLKKEDEVSKTIVLDKPFLPS